MNNLQNKIKNDVLRIRKDSEAFLTDACTVKHKTGEYVHLGQTYFTYDTGTAVPCRFINRSGNESTNVAAQQRTVQQVTFTGVYRLQLPFDTIITVGDKIEYVVDNQLRIFEVTYVPPKHSMIGAFVVQLQEDI